MKKFVRTVSVLSLMGVVASSVAAGVSKADYVRCDPYGHHCHHYDGDYGDGFWDGVQSALLTVYSILTTGDEGDWDSDTLMQAAALYEADGVKTPVFEAFAGAMAEKMTAQMGAEQMKKIDADTLNQMIADQILDSAAK